MPELLGSLAPLVGGDVVGAARFVVGDVTHDSREVRVGSLFVAIDGEHHDGHDFVAGLFPGSAACVSRLQSTTIPQLLVADTRAALGVLADAVHGSPSAHMDVVGVTGTNGKTSVTYLVAAILEAAGRRAACLGTTGVVRPSETRPLPRTTPEASDLHRLLADLRRDDVDAVALEVSSHALALHRVAGVRFAAAGFTNLSQDHLDFHADLDDYFEAKAALFELTDRKVINGLDSYGRRLLERHPDALVVGRDVTAAEVSLGLTRTSFELCVEGASVQVTIPVGGTFTVENALVAAGLAHVLEIPLEAIAAGLGEAWTVPGRFESIEVGQPFDVIVDYAHTPEGLTGAIGSASELTTGRVIAIVGAGGDRDHSKRVPMGSAAGKADVVILTSDNPRSEDPDSIIADLRVGTDGSDAVVITQPDRALAIREALALATTGDTVLVLGKGHETTQQVGDRLIPFDDRLVARSILEEMYP